MSDLAINGQASSDKEKSQGCYPGCYYYTDSCFREDCKKGNNRADELERQQRLIKVLAREIKATWEGQKYLEAEIDRLTAENARQEELIERLWQ